MARETAAMGESIFDGGVVRGILIFQHEVNTDQLVDGSSPLDVGVFFIVVN
jgi:hypothetical protein